MASIFPGLKAPEAAVALSRYLDKAGIERTEDRISALLRWYAVTWLEMLDQVGYTDFEFWDVHSGRDLLVAQLRAQLEAQPCTIWVEDQDAIMSWLRSLEPQP